jgi:hypothetical protein
MLSSSPSGGVFATAKDRQEIEALAQRQSSAAEFDRENMQVSEL